MKNETLEKHFKSIGARVKFLPFEPEPWRNPPPSDSFTIDVKSDKSGDYFEFRLGNDAPEFEILQVKPKERHLLIYSKVGQRFLCGHDERNWFAAGISNTVSTIRAAKQSLLPSEIWKQVQKLPAGIVDKRRNAVFIRQGEWFFMPANVKFPEKLIHKNEPLQRTARSKPHICQELYRVGGEVVYVVSGQTYSEEEYTEKRKENPEHFRDLRVRSMVRNPLIYARGNVRHGEHATIKLAGWHRVFINSEMVANTVTFLD